jgi:hypothetical protein
MKRASTDSRHPAVRPARATSANTPFIGADCSAVLHFAHHASAAP